MDEIRKTGYVRINVLYWADILVAYALFVLQDYLTDVWELSFTHAAAIVNFLGGITRVLPVFFLFFVDTFLGNFGMLVISSITYSVGIGLLTMSTPPVLAESTGTCKQYKPECIGNTQKVVFYVGIALIAVGVAGNLVSVEPFLEEQEEEPGDNPNRCFLKYLGSVFVALVSVTGAIALPYVKPWSLRYGIPAICTVVATGFFLTGWCGKWKYKKEKPQGSPITNICRVFVAATCKLCKSYPLDRKFHKEDENESFKRTRLLRCLEKAAIISDDEDQEKNSWRLCSVAEVEEAKIAVRMVPMWSTFIICGIVSSIGNTYFVEQAKNMDRHIGKLKLPPQILLLLFNLTKGLFGKLANCLLAKKSSTGESATKEVPKKIAPAVGIVFGMAFSVLCCITAARIEIRRLRVIRRHGLLDKPDEDIPLNILWLVFQFVLLAGLDSFLENSVAEFYEHQSPPSMKKYIKYFTKGVSGLGYMFSVLSVYVVGKISEGGGKPNWFQHTLNKSRLDRYFWVLAALSSANLIVFIVVASCYRYNDLEAESEEDATGGGEGGELYKEGNYECKCCC